MAYIPAKMIESKLRKKGIIVNGYYVLDSIAIDYLEEAKRLGMDDGITEGFDFSSEYLVEGAILTFFGEIIEDYRQISPSQEVPYYYPYFDSCLIKQGDKEETIDLDIYWGK